MTEIVEYDEIVDTPTPAPDSLKGGATDREIENFYSSSRFKIVQDRVDYLVIHIKDLIENLQWLNTRPEYQRRLRWSDNKKSALVESIIMNVPVPPVFLFESELSRYEVMDGQQRISALVDYINNKYELTGLEVWGGLNKKRFLDLPPTIKRALQRARISGVVLSPESSGVIDSSRLRKEVFDRLNTGGERLNAQELRNAIYGGRFNELLISLSGLKRFTDVWDIPAWADNMDADGNPNEKLKANGLYRKMEDVEIVLRFFAFLEGKAIVGSVKKILDETMERNLNSSEEDLDIKKELFVATLEKAIELLGNSAFKLYNKNGLRTVRSKPLFDATMVALARGKPKWAQLNAPEKARQNVEALLKPNSDAYETVVGRANTANAIRQRIAALSKALFKE
jgi:hypothetical protein